MIKSGRFLIYFSLSLIIVSYNFIFEMVFTSLEEAIEETLILFPMILGFIFLIYWLRLKVFGLHFIKLIFQKGQLQKNTFIVFLIALKTLVIALVSRLIPHFFFADDGDERVWDLILITITISVLVVIIFIYFFEDYITSIKEKHNMAIALSNAEVEKTYSMYNSLKNQLNPHFLFNSFNSLLSLISINPHKAESFVEELSSIYRYNLSKSEELVVTLSEELEMIQSYIHLQKIRFGEALDYKVETKGQHIDEYLLPPMTLQLLVENAIKHNKVNKANPLAIHVRLKGDFVTVRNTLQLKHLKEFEKTSFGIGLKNIKRQLKLITDEQLVIHQSENKFEVSVPLLKTQVYD